MNTNRGPGPAPGADQSALSLLVNAADSHEPPRMQREAGGPLGARSLADTLRLRGLGGDPGSSLEEQLLLHQQQQQQQQQHHHHQQQQQHHHQQQQQQHQQQNPYGGLSGSVGLLSQLRDSNNILSQLGQQQQLASLLGLGNSNPGFDVRSVLAAAQMRQSHGMGQLNHADLLSLASRHGGLSGLSGLLGGLGGSSHLASAFGNSALSGLGNSAFNAGSLSSAGLGGNAMGGGNNPAPGGSSGFGSDLDGLQRLEELERQQRLLAASSGNAPVSASAALNRREVAAEPPAPPPAPPARQESDDSRTGRNTETSNAAASPKVKPNAAPASANHDTTKEEFKKAPGSVIVPCRARGMPMDHNFKTAYFVIPENVRHGEELICSYFACRNAGIKFRYCSHCKVPVAKRNFRKRHKHGGADLPQDAGDDSGDDDAADSTVHNKGIPSQITASRGGGESVEADGISSQSADSTDQPDKLGNSEQDNNGMVRSSMNPLLAVAAAKNKKKPSVDASEQGHVLTTAAEANAIDKERRDRWAALLAKRPSTQDGDSMSAWLMEVLAVSDLNTPLKCKVVPDTKAASEKPTTEKEEEKDGQEADEEALPGALNGIVKKKRPATTDQVDAAGKSSSESQYAGGSFAEWKERKKQKKSKLGSPAAGPTEEV